MGKLRPGSVDTQSGGFESRDTYNDIFCEWRREFVNTSSGDTGGNGYAVPIAKAARQKAVKFNKIKNQKIEEEAIVNKYETH